MQKLLFAALIAAATAVLPVSNGWAETTLRFATTDSPRAHLNVHILHPWAERINEQGKGILRIDVRDGPAFANQGNYFERISSNISQIAWGVQAILSSKLVKSAVVGLPFVADKAEPASVAFWRLLQSGLLDSEYQDTVPLFVNVFPQSGLHLRQRVDSIESLKGLKMVAGGRLTAALIEALGGAPLSLHIGEHYEALQRGTADGNLIMFTAFQPFKLGEVTSFHVDTNLGTSGGWVFMMRKVFDGLTKEQQELLMSNSGENQSRLFGKFWDLAEANGRKAVASDPKHTIIELPPAVAAAWKKAALSVTDQWAKSVPDGEKILAAYKAELAKAEAEN